MNAMIIYMVKVTVYIFTFYLIYTLLLKKDTTLARNRAFIILSLVIALVLPLVTINNQQPPMQFFGKLLSDAFISGEANVKEPGIKQGGALQFIYSIYITGVVIFLFKLIIDFSALIVLILRHKNSGSRIIRFQDFSTSGFSAMGYIFINTRLSPEEAGEIINHEKKHLSQNHYIDIIFMEFLIAFQWFNPFVHIFNSELRAIHEFQADRDCLRSGIPLINYQSLILSQVFRSGAFKLSNSFANPSLIKKRMLMMTRKRSSHLASLKLLLVIPITGFLFLSLSANHLPPPLPPPLPLNGNEVPFVIVEDMPVFPGGDAALLKYIKDNTIYPEPSKTNKVQGRAIVRFCVMANGGVNQVSVLKGVSPDLDAEAIRVVKTLPAFRPGHHNGQAVPVWYLVPITFGPE